MIISRSSKFYQPNFLRICILYPGNIYKRPVLALRIWEMISMAMTPNCRNQNQHFAPSQTRIRPHRLRWQTSCAHPLTPSEPCFHLALLSRFFRCSPGNDMEMVRITGIFQRFSATYLVVALVCFPLARKNLSVSIVRSWVHLLHIIQCRMQIGSLGKFKIIWEWFLSHCSVIINRNHLLGC